MGEKFRYMIPFVAALFATSVVSNLISLVDFEVRLQTCRQRQRGSRGIYHDHRAEDQDQWFRWISQRIYTADSGYDTI